MKNHLANNHLPKKHFTVFIGVVLFTALILLALTSCTLERPPIRPSKNLNKDEPVYYDFLARKYYNREEYDKAIFQYERLLETFSNQSQWQKDLAWAEYEIGYTYYRMGENELAVERFNRVLSNYDIIAPRILAQKMIDKINQPK